jgi:uncharacterized protein (DUF952 family)
MERPTYHLVAAPSWQACDPREAYLPEAFADEGFIHCTDGEAEMMAVANRYYAGDSRRFLVLLIRKARLRSPWRYDDAGRLYPHVYGPLNRDAIAGVYEVQRAEDGRFTGLGSALHTERG